MNFFTFFMISAKLDNGWLGMLPNVLIYYYGFEMHVKFKINWSDEVYRKKDRHNHRTKSDRLEAIQSSSSGEIKSNSN